MAEVALDRDALYYPYIHIRDANWLKATLLCFPQVRRMVPPDFHLTDLEEIKPFRTVLGADGRPLLTEEFTAMEGYDSPIYRAQLRLLEALQANEALIKTRFSRTQTSREFPQEPDNFQMHTGKMLVPLADYLESRNLGWYPRTILSTSPDTRWLALHPRLGEAIMSVIAIAIARAKGLDIVTSSGRIHHGIAVLDETEIMDDLLERGEARSTASPAELADELAEVVLTTRFDVSRLTAEQVAELIKEGKDLRAFKTALLPIAQSLPDLTDPLERERRLRQKSDEVIDSWMSYRQSLPRFALDALVEVGDMTMPAIVSTVLAAGGAAIAATATAGLSLGVLIWKGRAILHKFRERQSDPMRFLSQLEKAGASLVLQPKPLGPARPLTLRSPPAGS